MLHGVSGFNQLDPSKTAPPVHLSISQGSKSRPSAVFNLEPLYVGNHPFALGPPRPSCLSSPEGYRPLSSPPLPPPWPQLEAPDEPHVSKFRRVMQAAFRKCAEQAAHPAQAAGRCVFRQKVGARAWPRNELKSGHARAIERVTNQAAKLGCLARLYRPNRRCASGPPGPLGEVTLRRSISAWAAS
jgi:hypothetical protein